MRARGLYQLASNLCTPEARAFKSRLRETRTSGSMRGGGEKVIAQSVRFRLLYFLV